MLSYYNEQYIMIKIVKLLQWWVYHYKQMLSYYNEVYIMINKC